MRTLIKVDFHGDTIWAGPLDTSNTNGEDETIYVALKPIIENFGLDWASQFSRLKRSEILAPSIVMMTIETPAGPRETICLPLNLIPGFLFGISAERIADPEARARVIAYQRECHAVLFRHFFGRPEAIDPTEAWDWEAIGRKLALIREIRLTMGRKQAQAQMIAFGLAQGEERKPVAMPTGALSGMDFVRQFLDERTAEDEAARVQATPLFQAFGQWCSANDVPTMTSTAFGRCLTGLGVRRTMGAGRIHYLGLRLKHISEMLL